MSAFNLQTLARPNILALEPYVCARDSYKVGVLLDANENTHGPSLASIDEEELKQELNRYPDPHQVHVKQLLCNFRNGERTAQNAALPEITPENICFGVGSDESIDALIRIFCVPSKDKLLICPPTYGMYTVSAQVNDVEVVKVPLEFNKGNFQIQPDLINEKLSEDASIKIVYICSPGNPTGTLIERARIEKVLNHPTWNGIVVVDEAYVDFAEPGSSFAPLVTKYPNLAVMQTISKSFGLAGARLGCVIADKPVARLLNNLKAPYNISTPTSVLAERALSPEGIAVMKTLVKKIIDERERMVVELPKIHKGVGKFVSGLDSNFLLVEILDEEGEPSSPKAIELYKYLAEKKQVVVRYRGNEPGCPGCLRISIGTREENDKLLSEMRVWFDTLY